MELDSIDERVLVDRSGVCGTLAQRLAVRLARSSDVLPGDRRERDKLDGVKLDLTGADPGPWLTSSNAASDSALIGRDHAIGPVFADDRVLQFLMHAGPVGSGRG